MPAARALIDTGIGWEVDLEIELSYYYGKICPRSGLAYKFGLDVLAGVIDADYTDEIKVLLINHGELPYLVKKGDRIAQLVVHQYQVIKGDLFAEPVALVAQEDNYVRDTKLPICDRPYDGLSMLRQRWSKYCIANRIRRCT